MPCHDCDRDHCRTPRCNIERDRQTSRSRPFGGVDDEYERAYAVAQRFGGVGGAHVARTERADVDTAVPLAEQVRGGEAA